MGFPYSIVFLDFKSRKTILRNFIMLLTKLIALSAVSISVMILYFFSKVFFYNFLVFSKSLYMYKTFKNT